MLQHQGALKTTVLGKLSQSHKDSLCDSTGTRSLVSDPQRQKAGWIQEGQAAARKLRVSRGERAGEIRLVLSTFTMGVSLPFLISLKQQALNLLRMGHQNEPAAPC